MPSRTQLFAALVTIFALVVLAACGGSPPAALTDIPVYPGATELKPGESTIGDTLAQNNQQNAALTGQLGVGGKVEQKGFSLPKEATWDQVKSFYDEKLKGSGWTTSMANDILQQANQNNPLFQSTNWQKDKQNVTVLMLTSPTNADQKELIVSLATQ